MTNKAFALLVASCAWICVATTPAKADQSFVCADGSVVTVAFKDLEKMKRTNACVAGYFGLKVRTPIVAALKTEPVIRRTGRIKTKRNKKANRKPTHAQLISKSHARAQKTPEVSVGTDYRNVRIINAKPGKKAFHRHLF